MGTPSSTTVNEPGLSAVGSVESRDVEVPQSEIVDDDFFKDTLFIGDSLTKGIELNGIFPYDNVLAYDGIDPETAATLKIIETKNGNLLTLLDAANNYSPSRIYIMLGANGISYLSTQTLLDSYDRFVAQIMEIHPDSDIFIQSILPVTAEFEEDFPYHSNTKIDEMNDLLRQMCKEKEIYFLNVSDVFKDDDGAMIKGFSANDGLHLNGDAYDKWAEYLKCHTINHQ